MAQIIVTPKTFCHHVNSIAKERELAIDTETTGLYAYNGDALFCITISTLENDYYFDFHEKQNNPTLLNRGDIPAILANFKGLVFAQNAKFDMHMLYKEGLDLTKHNVHCTEAIGRLVNNEAMALNLATLAKTVGLEKSKEVDLYIKQHKLYRIVNDEKCPCYDQVPFEIISKYAMMDTHITLRVGLSQLKSLREQQSKINLECPTLQKERNLFTLLETEKKLTKALFRMEMAGVRIDRQYAKNAFEYESDQCQKIADLFKEWSGFDFKDDKTTLVQALKESGEIIPVTDKGNPCLDKAALEKMTSPLAIMVKDHRRSYLMAHTYYENFLFFADKNDVIHPNFQQGGTRTGRLSCREPNSQNIPKKGEDSSKFPVRKCFIPTDGFLWYSFDWKQIEYRLMLDYAGEMGLINMIKNGYDVHTATGELIGMIRDLAKNVNFALLYGTGVDHFAFMIKKTVMDAKKIKNTYFNKLPKVRNLIDKIKYSVMQRGYIITHFGRKLKVDKDKSYVGANYLIQGGCADIMKIALVQIDELLQNEKCKSFAVLTVHDEVDLMIHPSEIYLVEKISTIMRDVYKHTHLPMGVDVEYSETSWHELKEFKNGTEG